MSKFKHLFKLTEFTKNYRIYSSDNNNVRIDFVSGSCIRVAVYKDDAVMLPTFSINPENIFSANGRNRLDTAGFSMCAPEIAIESGKEIFRLPCGIDAELNIENFLLKYYKNNNVLFADRAPLAYNFENEFGTGVDAQAVEHFDSEARRIFL